jgi:hypothetical protein
LSDDRQTERKKKFENIPNCGIRFGGTGGRK